MIEATEILTIGHSSHALDAFIPLLQQNGITAVADVRSSPYSRHNPEFNRESLKQALNQHGIGYSFLGSELGGRPQDASCYGEDGQVRFELLAKTEQFRRGIERVMQGAARYRLALMCAERDPIHCHRTILIAPGLLRQGATVRHILSDGTLEPHDRSVDRLFEASGMPRSGLFGSDKQREELQVRAGRRIAFTDPERVATSVRELP